MASMQPLTTKDVVKDELQLSVSTHDSWIDRQIKVASQRFCELAGRNFHRVDGHTEQVSVRENRARLRVGDFANVRAVNSVKYDGAEVDSGLYTLESTGMLVHEQRWTGTSFTDGVLSSYPSNDAAERLFEVDYDAGYVTPAQAPFGAGSEPRDLPYTIEEAVVQYVVMKYAQRGKDESVKSMSILSSSIEWQGERMPATFKDAVLEYRNHANFVV